MLLPRFHAIMPAMLVAADAMMLWLTLSCHALMLMLLR